MQSNCIHLQHRHILPHVILCWCKNPCEARAGKNWIYLVYTIENTSFSIFFVLLLTYRLDCWPISNKYERYKTCNSSLLHLRNRLLVLSVSPVYRYSRQMILLTEVHSACNNIATFVWYVYVVEKVFAEILAAGYAHTAHTLIRAEAPSVSIRSMITVSHGFISLPRVHITISEFKVRRSNERYFTLCVHFVCRGFRWIMCLLDR